VGDGPAQGPGEATSASARGAHPTRLHATAEQAVTGARGAQAEPARQSLGAALARVQPRWTLGAPRLSLPRPWDVEPLALAQRLGAVRGESIRRHQLGYGDVKGARQIPDRLAVDHRVAKAPWRVRRGLRVVDLRGADAGDDQGLAGTDAARAFVVELVAREDGVDAQVVAARDVPEGLAVGDQVPGAILHRGQIFQACGLLASHLEHLPRARDAQAPALAQASYVASAQVILLQDLVDPDVVGARDIPERLAGLYLVLDRRCWCLGLGRWRR